MRKWASALIAAASFSAGPSVAADPPRFVTSFKFEVKFVDGVQTYNENQGIVVNVWLPPELGWQCLRLSPALIDRRMRGSFACSNDGGKTEALTMVGCKPAEADALRTAAMRLYAPRPDGKPQGWSDPDAGAVAAVPAFGKWVDLTVSCESSPAR
jgi:hypothetical protein